jgi:hypothetical protein
VSTQRFGTFTLLETATYSSGPLVTNDVITTVSWAPTWGSTNTNLVATQLVFMDLTFTVTNALPAAVAPATVTNGYITLTVTEDIYTNTNVANWLGATATGAANCYIVNYINSAVDCTVTGTGTMTISALPTIAAGTAIKVRSVVKINTTTGNAQVSSINTFINAAAAATTGGCPVDIATNQASFAVASSTTIVAATSFTWNYHAAADPTPVYTAGGSFSATAVLENYTLLFVVQTGIAISATSQVTINCPFSSAADDFSIALPSPVYKFETASGLPADASTTPTGTLTTAPTFTAGTSGTALGSLTFTAAYATTPATWYTYQRFEIKSAAAATSYIQLPKVAQNHATAYECRVAVTTTAATYTGFIQLKITPQPWNAKNFDRFCTDVTDGLPARLDITPAITLGASSSTATYYVEVEVANGATGATVGFGAFSTVPTSVSTTGTSRNHNPFANAVTYPFGRWSGGSVPTGAQMYTTGSSTVIALTGYGALAYVAAASGYSSSVVFPTGGWSVSTPVASTIRSYYLLAADPRYKFITHSDTDAPSAIISSAATWGTIGVGTSSASGINGNAISALNLNLVVTANVPNTVAYFHILLPAGWTAATSATVKLPSSSTALYPSFFSHTSRTFNYPGVFFSNQAAASTYTPWTSGDPAAGTVSLTGLTIALGLKANTTFRASYIPANLSGACTAVGVTGNFDSQTGDITNVSITPSSIKQRGPDGVNISHTVSFTLAHIIPLGGVINMTFNSGWVAGYSATGTTCSGCTTTGLTAATGSTLTCALSGNGVTVSGFAELAAGSATVTITVFGLLGPTSVTGTGTATNFVQSLTSSMSLGGAVIDTMPAANTGSAVTITASSTAGVTTWTTKKTYPSTAGTTYVDLYLKFSLPHALPACGSIAITSPLVFKSSGDIKNSCFFSPLQYGSCSISGTVLTLYLNQAYTANSVLELYLDSMVDNPTSTTTTSGGFQALATWGSGSYIITVDQDTGSLQSTQTYTATSILSTTITGSTTAALSFSPKTSGEMANYVFDFKDTANFAATDQYWIVFPAQYDYFLGDTWTWFSNEPNVYYIGCTSTQLGTAWCQVDHNIVIVTGSNAITGSTQIVITINGVCNPIAGQTSAFQIYHVDTNGNFVTVNQNYGTVTPTATAANNIYVRSLTMTDRRLFRSSDYTWRLYLSDTMNTDSQLQVMFPREYMLNYFDKKDSYSCSSTWLDISASATIKTQQNWNSASSCSASGNTISLSAPTTSISFTATNIVTLTVASVGNAQFGQSRSAFAVTQDFDVTDAVLWPLYAYWTSQYTFFVYRTSSTNQVYTSRSYPNMSPAYANLYDGYRPVLVNQFNPQSKLNRIVVYAGTQSGDLYITTAATSSPMAAKQIVFTPTTNSRTPDGGKLKYTSVADGWTLFQSYYQSQFRVCAAIDTTKGLYYIDWSNNETKQTGLNDVQYDVPASTLVEVIGKTSGKYTFAISNIPNVSTGFTSVPIKVSISNAPCSDVTVNIAVSGTPANISVTPTALTFNQDINVRYFQVQVASNYDLTLGTVQTLLFTLTGTDAFAYAVAASAKFTITQASTTQVAGNVVNWGLGQPGRTFCSVTPSSDQVGVIYYQLAPSGTAVPSFSSLKSSVSSLVNQNSTASDGKDEGANSQSDPQTGETWEDYMRRLYKGHMQSTWSGSISMFATTAVTTLTFNWLWASTTYQISGYLDNLSTSSTSPTVRTETITTLATADSQPFSLKFTGQVAQSFCTKVAQTYASVIGANPARLTICQYATSTSRVLQGTTPTTVAYTTFTYTLLVNRFSESPSPTDQAKVTGTAFTSLSNLLVADGLANALNSVTNNAIPTRVTPTWTTAPASGGSTTSSVTVNLRSSTAGRSCCVALTGSSTAPTPEQVMLSLDATNTAVSGTCINTDTTVSSNSVQVSSLQPGTSYYVYCTATDSYPLWPTYMSYSTTAPMTPVTISTLGNNVVVDDGASYLGGLLALLALLFH